MSLAILSFIAGVLSVLAPCVLPVLPVILGGSLGSKQWYRPLIIILSTAVFITLFTVLLKVSTALINIPQEVWTTISAIIIIAYGATLMFPELWDTVRVKLGLDRTNDLADKAKQNKGIWGDILLGASLGPIFASCSPTYAVLLSTVFPQSIAQGILYTIVYSIGFALALAIVVYGGRSIIGRISGLTNPNGWFKKILGVILVITGMLIITGFMKKLEVTLLESGFLDITKVEQAILEKNLPNSRPDPDNTIYPGAVQQTGSQVSEPDFLNEDYRAPDIVGLENWLNSSGYSSLSELSGKVVLIDFWTYSCINCIRTLPYLQQLHEMYADKGLVIIGVHAPEFQFERDINNVRKAVEKYGLGYAVVQDNNFKTWNNYNNRFRPAKYIIDKQGKVRYTHFGEGSYEETEKVVQYLLGIDSDTTSLVDPDASGSKDITPETYLGTSRRANMVEKPSTVRNEWWLEGDRQENAEKVQLSTVGGSVTINAYAQQVNLVLGSDTPITATIMIDGETTETITIDGYNLYNLYQGTGYNDHKVSIKFDQAGVQAYAYTFG